MSLQIKYQETLRRFHVRVTDEKIDLDVDRLWEKLHSLFNLTPDTELILTYIDEDGDEVALVDDDDLRDVGKQALDPLRITVKLNSEKIGTQRCSSGSSTPLRALCLQSPSRKGLEVLKTVPDPVYGAVLKLSTDLASKASSSASGFAELIDYFSKVSLTYLSHCTDSQHTRQTMIQSDVSGMALAAGETKNLGPAMVGHALIAETEVVQDEVTEKEKAVDERIEKMKPCLTTSHLSPVGDTEWFIGKSSNFPTEKATNKQDANIEPYPCSFHALDPIKGDHVGGRAKSLIPQSFGHMWAPYPRPIKVPEFCSSPGPKDVHSIPSIPVERASGFRCHPASKAGISSGRSTRNVDSFHVFHCGIFCDGCGVHPITGPRFKSKVEDNYDLCMICFAEMGNASDYIRMDHPVIYPHHVLYDSCAKDRDPASSPDCMGYKVKSCLSKMDSCFIKDVNITNDTVMAPSTPFTKIWRLKNNGIVVWPRKTVILWIGGDELSNDLSVELQIPASGLAINQELDVAVDCIAPELPRKVQFLLGIGFPLWPKVVACVAARPQETVRIFNLNLPPLSSSCLNDPETSDTSVESSCVPSAASEDEGMSFKSAYLSEDVSTMGDDSLDLDDVSEFSEWDPIPDELLLDALRF
ncbi:hypothetical protein F511_18928 [Dorcoceras hygrometricum]|uniref:ZZ-type domain-containing protein n=1 Tax=Dorcoceras hygrometricum TaxID=472368 RepID=A0A2Z7AUT3_9LAMI|nr:hypothetical protein F511_18928 [Dorcoceras hygrometricum]